MRNSDYRSLKNYQQGMALIICLLLLLVLTVVTVSAMQTTTLEEKMAGNLRDHDLAFQSAETGLNTGEHKQLVLLDFGDYSSSSIGNGDDNGNGNPGPPPNKSKTGRSGIWDTIGIDPTPGNGTPWWLEPERDLSWWFEANTYASDHLANVSNPSRYIIEELESIKDNGLGTCTYEDCSSIRVFRLTSRAEGGSTDTVVYLQSVSAHRYSK